MIKLIFTQIWNRRQNNSWIIIELVLVFCLIWYMTDYFFVLTYNYSIPNYRNIDHTFLINIGEYQSDNPEFNENEKEPEAREANFMRVLQIIRNFPGVENLSFSANNSTPETLSYSGSSFKSPEDSTIEVMVQHYSIEIHSDYFRTFGYTTNNGKNPVSVFDFDWTQPNGVVISHSFAQELFPKEKNVFGKTFGKGDNPFKVIGIVDDIKRFDHERPYHTMYKMFTPNWENFDLRSATIAIRSNAALSDGIFRENLEKELRSKLHIGNFYFTNITPFNVISSQAKISMGLVNEIQIRIYLMLFFLGNILLCVIGTFWYRVSVRKDEIGLRKAMGASGISIRNNLLIEGLCLLTIAAPIAMIISFQFVHADLVHTLKGSAPGVVNTVYLPDHTILRFLITNAITWIIMAAVVIAAVWLPARKAAAMEAAEALHYE